MRSMIEVALLTRIREQVIPISIAGVIFAVGYLFFVKMPPPRTSGEIVQWFLLLAVFFMVFSIFPAIAIAFGWYTGNRACAVLAGVLPFPLVSVALYFLIRAHNMVFIRVPDTLFFMVILSAICGLAGYCAAHKTKPFLAVSVVLTGLWLFIWMNSFN